MNIFSALNYGKGNINEENFSSFLGFLLNPKEEPARENNNIFLKKLVEIFDNKELKQLIKTCNFDDCKLRYEYSVYNGHSHNKIDIVVKIDNAHYIAIENKIKRESSQDGMQLINEYNGLKKKIENKNAKIYLFFLIPAVLKNDKSSPANKEYKNTSIKEDGKNPIIPDKSCQILTWEKLADTFDEICEDKKFNYKNLYLTNIIKNFTFFIRNNRCVEFSLKDSKDKEHKYKLERTEGKTKFNLSVWVESKKKWDIVKKDTKYSLSFAPNRKTGGAKAIIYNKLVELKLRNSNEDDYIDTNKNNKNAPAAELMNYLLNNPERKN